MIPEDVPEPSRRPCAADSSSRHPTHQATRSRVVSDWLRHFPLVAPGESKLQLTPESLLSFAEPVMRDSGRGRWSEALFERAFQRVMCCGNPLS